MIIYRNQLPQIFLLINRFAAMQFDINTQYKFIKLKKIIEPEVEIYQEQFKSLSRFYKIDEHGQPILDENGGIKIAEENLLECQKCINEINSIEITIPDYYFSLDELIPLNLTMSELELLEPFVK